MKALNNVGIAEIVYYEVYERIKDGGKEREIESEAWELAEKRGVKIRQYNPKFEVRINGVKRN